MTCSVIGCARSGKLRRGMCCKHYDRLRKGRPLTVDVSGWRPVVGYEACYLVSDDGQVYSRRRDKAMRPSKNAEGYLQLSLRDECGVQTSYGVHRLVAAAFLGPMPEGCVLVRHLDGDPSNNHFSNLAYGTHRDNALDRVRHGRDNSARKTHCPAGHAYDEANTYRESNGSRSCRACQRDAARVRRAERKASAA